MQPVQALAATLAVFGVVAGLLAAVRSGRRHQVSALGHALLAVVLLWTAVWLWPIGAGIGGYDPLRDGQAVAEVYFEQLVPGRFRATMTRLPAGRMQVFDLDGDAWRIDARTLHWRGWALAAGLAPRYQLDRLTSLAAGANDKSVARRTYELGDPGGLGFWQRIRAGRYWRRVVDARLVYGPDTAMTHGARYEMVLSAQGLDALPINDAAAAAQAAH